MGAIVAAPAKTIGCACVADEHDEHDCSFTPRELQPRVVDCYEGETSEDGAMHGRGTLLKSNGAVFQGSWDNDKQDGYGRRRWSSGDSYQGEFKNGSFHGKGCYTYPDGSSYEGSFIEGKRHGVGSFSKAAGGGDGYQGQWANDLCNGQGVAWFHGGERYEGDWVNGEMHGHGTYTDASGGTVEGMWCNNARKVPAWQSDAYREHGVLQSGCALPSESSWRDGQSTETPSSRREDVSLPGTGRLPSSDTSRPSTGASMSNPPRRGATEQPPK